MNVPTRISCSYSFRLFFTAIALIFNVLAFISYSLAILLSFLCIVIVRSNLSSSLSPLTPKMRNFCTRCQIHFSHSFFSFCQRSFTIVTTAIYLHNRLNAKNSMSLLIRGRASFSRTSPSFNCAVLLRKKVIAQEKRFHYIVSEMTILQARFLLQTRGTNAGNNGKNKMFSSRIQSETSVSNDLIPILRY